MINCTHSSIILTNFEESFDHRVCVKKQIELLDYIYIFNYFDHRVCVTFDHRVCVKKQIELYIYNNPGSVKRFLDFDWSTIF